MQIHKGKLINRDGRVFLQMQYSPTSMVMDVPIEEVLEDYAGQGVELTVCPRNFGSPIWKSLVPNWDTQLETTTEPDYEHCSEEGREKFLDMKVGLMVHWGLYTHLGTLESWAAYAENAPMWFMDIYYTLWQMWNPTDFDAEKWASLLKRAGLQFIQITSKHCEGFALWDTKTTVKVRRRIGHKSDVVVNPVEDAEIHYSVMDSPFKRDIIKELSNTFHKHGLGFGLYYPHMDWEDPNFRWQEGNRCYDPAYNPQDNPQDWQAMIDREREQLRELFTNYGKIDQIFFDCSWCGLAWEEMKSMFKELRQLQPDCMFSDRGLGPYGDFTSPERWIPKEGDTEDPRVKGMLWQVCDPIGTHWSYVPGEVYKDKTMLLHNMIEIIAKGGTFVMDAGPMPHGFFADEAVDLLETIGRWLHVNGEAIYATRYRSPYQDGDTNFFTKSKDGQYVYLIHIGWPFPQFQVQSVVPKENSPIFCLGIKNPCSWHMEENSLIIELPPEFNHQIPCEYAFCFKIEES